MNRALTRHRPKKHSSARANPSAPPPSDLHHIEDESLLTMRHGDIFILDGMEDLAESIDPAFFAVLACPRCGTKGLITSSQYYGVNPVVCGSETCSCRFRIEDQSKLTYLPVI
ncbi:MAG TPA: hypothetical protein VFD30_03690 [Terriglobia bacterium]|nr:hypothetical protein [Terriglobia bacterium]